MPFHNAFDAESQINTMIRLGEWEKAITAIDDWLHADPERVELYLRKAQLYRQLKRYELGLQAVREYRMHKPDGVDAVFGEVEFLLDLQQTAEALQLLEHLPAEQWDSAQAIYYRGKVEVVRNELTEALRHFWNAYQMEPGFNRALMAWATVAMRVYGRRWVRAQLEKMLTQERKNPTVAVSVGLALNMVDSRYGQHFLRRAVDRYTDYVPTPVRDMRQKSTTAVDRTNGTLGAAEAYRLVSEQLFIGHFAPGLDAYYKAVNADPAWLTILAPLVAEVLVDDLVRPEEARVILEDALKKDPTDYRLHLSYTKVFLQLGFGEEALSSANCALELAPEAEKAIALIQRAGAHLMLKQRDLAMQDLRGALARIPEAGNLVSHDPSLKHLLKDKHFRTLIMGQQHLSFWERFKQWMTGE